MINLHWYIIPSDGAFPWRPEGRRVVDCAYLRHLARAVELAGLDGALLATGAGSHDAWTLGSFLAASTERMKFIVAQHPGVTSPLMLAQQTATFDRFSQGRLILNVINGDEKQPPKHGVFVPHDERYALSDEYWSVWKRIMAGETVDFTGTYISVRGAKLQVEPYQKPWPELHFGGSSDAAMAVAAKHVDTYLTWGEPPPQAAEKVATVRALAKAQGRTMRFGLRIYVIVRETKAEAWAATQWLFDRIDRKAVEATRAQTRDQGSVGQARMDALVGDVVPDDVKALEVYPDIWAGIGLVRGGPGTAIVGDPETVVARIREYQAIGFDTFILSGYPLLEEAQRFGELVLPLLRKQESQAAARPLVLAAR